MVNYEDNLSMHLNLIIDIEVGQVTLLPNASNQMVSFSLHINDNNVALEPNMTFRLGIRESSSVDIGTPSEMTVLIADDDGEFH